VPDLDVGLLDDFLRQILSAQDTEHDTKEFRPCRGVEALKGGLIPLGDGGNQPDQLNRGQHSASSEVPTLIAVCPPTGIHTVRTISCAKPVHQARYAAVDIDENPDLAARVPVM